MHTLPIFHVSDICAPCGGRCCADVPGSTSPLDWGAPDREAMRAKLDAALASGRWAIDRWYGEDFETGPLASDVLFVRPAIKGREGNRFDEIEDGEPVPAWLRFAVRRSPTPCTFHGPKGCELGADDRPLECRTLEPIPGGKGCKQHGGRKRDRAIEWAPYRDVILSLSDGRHAA